MPCRARPPPIHLTLVRGRRDQVPRPVPSQRPPMTTGARHPADRHRRRPASTYRHGFRLALAHDGRAVGALAEFGIACEVGVVPPTACPEDSGRLRVATACASSSLEPGAHRMLRRLTELPVIGVPVPSLPRRCSTPALHQPMPAGASRPSHAGARNVDCWSCASSAPARRTSRDPACLDARLQKDLQTWLGRPSAQRVSRAGGRATQASRGSREAARRILSREHSRLWRRGCHRRTRCPPPASARDASSSLDLSTFRG